MISGGRSKTWRWFHSNTFFRENKSKWFPNLLSKSMFSYDPIWIQAVCNQNSSCQSTAFPCLSSVNLINLKYHADNKTPCKRWIYLQKKFTFHFQFENWVTEYLKTLQFFEVDNLIKQSVIFAMLLNQKLHQF